MGILLKIWAKKCKYIKKYQMTSYAVIMMMLYYLIKRGIVGPLNVSEDRQFTIDK
jgi:hypothetical protein